MTGFKTLLSLSLLVLSELITKTLHTNTATSVPKELANSPVTFCNIWHVILYTSWAVIAGWLFFYVWFVPTDTSLTVHLLLVRFEYLFEVKRKWTLEEITPYIADLATHKQNVGHLLNKHSRCSTAVNGVKVYTSRHPRSLWRPIVLDCMIVIVQRPLCHDLVAVSVLVSGSHYVY